MIRFLLHDIGQFDKKQSIGPVTWPHFDLLYLHEGSIELETEGHPLFQLSAGESILIYPQTQFQGRTHLSSATASVQHFEFNSKMEAAAHSDRWPHATNRIELFHNSKDSDIEKDIYRAIKFSRSENTEGNQEIREALLYLILAQLRQSGETRSEATAEQQILKNAREWAEANLSESITVEKMAHHAGLSNSHFRACFKKEHGESVGKFLLRSRIRKACELLRETRLPIKQISRETGYASVIPFHQAFQKQTGKTPARYRSENTLRG